MIYSDSQLTVIEAAQDSSIFLSGPAGTGKTAAAVQRVNYLIEKGVEGRKILLFFPQRNLAAIYQQEIQSAAYQGQSLPVSATFSGLAKRMLGLFWPAILQSYPDFQGSRLPTFLTLESSLYFMSKIVEPLITQQGYFSTVTIQRNRLYSQILDNLNKSALHGFPHTEISPRLTSAWIGEPSQELIYSQAQEAATRFRKFCYQENLLDFSLQIELFSRALSDIPLLSSHLLSQFSHLIYDNLEEDIPVAHDFINTLVPELSSCLLVYDKDAGYRSFLGASPASGFQLAERCKQNIRFEESFTNSKELIALNQILSQSIRGPLIKPPGEFLETELLTIHYHSFYPQMASWIAGKVSDLINSGSDPDNIVVLAPFLSDSLQFMLGREFENFQIPYTSHRPSRALRDEPVTQCLLTLSAIAHPAWDIYPSVYELALTFLQALKGLDLTRAYLLADGALHTRSASGASILLADFTDFPPSLQNRISFTVGDQYRQLWAWLNTYQDQPQLALDHFLSRLFGELLTRPDFGFHNDLLKGRTAAQIIESIGSFRKSAAAVLDLPALEAGREYYLMVKFGVLANQYLRSWTEVPSGKVLLAPAYTFLLNNKAVDFQFWLDIGSRGWYERIYQPLTNPHVLNRSWSKGEPWSDENEMDLNSKTLSCLTTGLIRRCRSKIFGCLTEKDERGYEQKGLLLQSLRRLNLSTFATKPEDQGAQE